MLRSEMTGENAEGLPGNAVFVLYHVAFMMLEGVIEAEGRQALTLWLCLGSDFNTFFLLFQAMYMFYALAIVCDDFFVPSLEKICEVRALYSQHVWAGDATILP